MRTSVLAIVGCAALTLGACSSPSVEKVYSTDFWVQPGKYDFLKCPDLAQRSMADSVREKELVSLMERANQEAIGPFINVTVYASDLEQVRADLALLQQTAREKGCDNLVATPKK